MANNSGYMLSVVTGTDAWFAAEVERLGSAEAVLSEAAGEKQNMFSERGLSKELFDLKMQRASRAYPTLVFRFIGAFGGDQTKTFFKNGSKADAAYQLAM
ncbi:hypothetical protein HFO56_23945 [Rhizobium laguerreae]|uniref:hypothetical protein n=1 Tax=Rhizobium laguerreae TaxID=1076926 RepID=UPI001C9012C6|nr:hypothetical protein [Rhizobium laguerreae]MBY3155381.1 hypothetical protein [Rhizobium laguerreae]